MKISSLFKNEDAVSPVIGVILMVAITVILAAVIGAFVLNLGGGQNAAPQASFEFTSNEEGSSPETLDISHDGGGALATENLKLTVGDGTPWDENTFNPNSDGFSDNSSDGAWTGSGSDATAGDTLSIQDNGDGGSGPGEFEDGEEINIIWKNPDSDDTSIIGTGTVSL